VRPETLVALCTNPARWTGPHSGPRLRPPRQASLDGRNDSEYARALLTLPDFILEREN